MAIFNCYVSSPEGIDDDLDVNRLVGITRLFGACAVFIELAFLFDIKSPYKAWVVTGSIHLQSNWSVATVCLKMNEVHHDTPIPNGQNNLLS